MFEFSLKNKKKGFAEFFTLFYLKDEKDLARLLAIVKLFELDDIQLKCIIRVKQSSEFLNLNKVNDAIKVEVKNTKKLLFSKEPHCDIEIEFYGRSLEILIDLAGKSGEALYIVPKNDGNKFIEFMLNDNDHNYINFCKEKYNIDEIKTQIKQIYKQKN